MQTKNQTAGEATNLQIDSPTRTTTATIAIATAAITAVTKHRHQADSEKLPPDPTAELKNFARHSCKLFRQIENVDKPMSTPTPLLPLPPAITPTITQTIT